jgi:hypothetical protein
MAPDPPSWGSRGVGFVLGRRNLLLMADIVNALQDSSTRHAERGSSSGSG